MLVHQVTYPISQDGHLTNTFNHQGSSELQNLQDDHLANSSNHQGSSELQDFKDVSPDKEQLLPEDGEDYERKLYEMYKNFLVDTPRQCYSSNDCGRLICTIMRLISESIGTDTPLFTVHDMSMARYRLISELMTQKVLYTHEHDDIHHDQKLITVSLSLSCA